MILKYVQKDGNNFLERTLDLSKVITDASPIIQNFYGNTATTKLLNEHIANISNPHGVTKAQLLLNNVDNVKQEPSITKSTGYLTWNGTAWVWKNETYLTSITKEMVEGVLTGNITSHSHSTYLLLTGGALTGNLSSTGIGAFDTLRLASGKYIGYSAAVGTAPTGGLSFGTTNNATFTGNITNNGGTLTVTKDGYSNIIARSANGGFSQVDFEHSNGTLASRTQTLSGDTLGQLRWKGRDNNNTYVQGAQIDSIAIGDYTTTSRGAALYFRTTASGSTTLMARYYIADTGHFTPLANNTYDLATSALRIRQAHVTAYYNYRTADNEIASHYLYETGSDSIVRRKTLANVRTELLQSSPDVNNATSEQKGLMSANFALMLEQNDLVENLVTADNGLAHKMRNFSGGALAKGDVVMIAPSGTAVKELGDSSNYFSLWSLSGVTKANSDLGKLYYTAESLWNTASSEHENVLIQFYKDSAGTQLVASYSNYSGMSPGAYSITISEENSSGVTGSVTLTLPSGIRLYYAFSTSRYVAPPTPFDVILATADTTESIGVVYSASPNDLDEVLVATTGIAYVRFKSGVTPLAGDWAFMSDTAGDADRATSPSTTFSTWLKNIGKVLETGTSGGLAKVKLGI